MALILNGIYSACMFGEPAVTSVIVQTHTTSQLPLIAGFKWTMLWKRWSKRSVIMEMQDGCSRRRPMWVSAGGWAIVGELSGRMTTRSPNLKKTCPLYTLFNFLFEKCKKTTSNIHRTWLRKRKIKFNIYCILLRAGTNEVWETRLV